MKKQERRFREDFLVFHFLSKALSREDSIAGEGGFPFCKIERENRESEFSFKSLFSSRKRKVGVRGPPWSFFLPYIICICIFIYSDFMNDERCV